ncbi:hypothetical protein DM02DRAFT_634292 [Periconia macrospinosa]|uniref:Uncharacterized protein n=1 Tax=Periconia macrospinosa TaxID=97972 RepID=A0A2V1D870_9PLEO|nr:hypothetical protein DM02DRAFT_634292 [Periconia macrospinosa]
MLRPLARCLAFSLVVGGTQALPFSVTDDTNISQLAPLEVTPRSSNDDWRVLLLGAMSIVVAAVVPIGIHLVVTRKPRVNGSQPQTGEQGEQEELTNLHASLRGEDDGSADSVTIPQSTVADSDLREFRE